MDKQDRWRAARFLEGSLSRRAFAATGLVTGFTLATGPLNAATIVTDAAGLDAGEVQIPVKDGKIPGYRAKPSGKTKLPMIVVVQEIFGVHEHIRDLCRRLAHSGYYAIAPSLYARQGDPGVYDMAHLRDLITNVVSKVPDDEVMSDIDSTVDFADTDGGNSKKLGITGFCWGGRVVWLYAAHSKKLKAGVAWYGGLKGQADPVLRPKSAVDLAPEIKVPVLGLYGGLDQGISAADIDAMRKALADAGNTKSRIDVFPDAQHGFNADYRPSYNEKDAKEGWSRLLAWMHDNGVG
jgi:carboxymethylenebutenolidase